MRAIHPRLSALVCTLLFTAWAGTACSDGTGVPDAGADIEPQFRILGSGFDGSRASGYDVPDWPLWLWDPPPGFGRGEFKGDPSSEHYPGPCVLYGKCSIGKRIQYADGLGGYGQPVNPNPILNDGEGGGASNVFLALSTVGFPYQLYDGWPNRITPLQSALHSIIGTTIPNVGNWFLNFDFALLAIDSGENKDDFASLSILEDGQAVEVFRVSRSDIGTTYGRAQDVDCGELTLEGETTTFDRCTDDGDPSDGDLWINQSVDLSAFVGSSIGIEILVSEEDHTLTGDQLPEDIADGYPVTLLIDNVQIVQQLDGKGTEGQAFMVGPVTEPHWSSPTFTWDFSDAPGFCQVIDDMTQTPSVTCSDDAQFDVSVQVSSDNSTIFGQVTIDNVPPTVTSFGGFPAEPIELGSAVSGLTGSFTDPGSSDTQTASVDWGDGSSDSGVSMNAIPGHTYSAPGVYAPVLRVEDDDGGVGERAYEFVTVFDPSSGFVTGGGWIISAAGSYRADPAIEGQASFGFVSRYRRGRSVPDGRTQFRFKAAGLEFVSTAYEWLIVAGPQAKFKGVGTINGMGNYGFMVSATDGAVTGGSDEDKFRIQIWDRDNADAVVYDNEFGSDPDGDPATVLGGGSIVIHTNR